MSRRSSRNLQGVALNVWVQEPLAVNGTGPRGLRGPASIGAELCASPFRYDRPSGPLASISQSAIHQLRNAL